MDCITENLSLGVNRLYSVSDSRITVYSKDNLITDKLENIMSGMNKVIEDNDLESRLFIFEKNSEKNNCLLLQLNKMIKD